MPDIFYLLIESMWIHVMEMVEWIAFFKCIRCGLATGSEAAGWEPATIQAVTKMHVQYMQRMFPCLRWLFHLPTSTHCILHWFTKSKTNEEVHLKSMHFTWSESDMEFPFIFPSFL